MKTVKYRCIVKSSHKLNICSAVYGLNSLKSEGCRWPTVRERKFKLRQLNPRTSIISINQQNFSHELAAPCKTVSFKRLNCVKFGFPKYRAIIVAQLTPFKQVRHNLMTSLYKDSNHSRILQSDRTSQDVVNTFDYRSHLVSLCCYTASKLFIPFFFIYE